MANVWDAIRKHQAEQKPVAAKPAPAQIAPATETPLPTDDKLPQEAPQAQAAPAGTAVSAASRKASKAGVLLKPASPKPMPRAGQNKDYSEQLVPYHDRGGLLAEEYRALRTNLLAQCASGRFCYVVTSAEAAEGKTVTCANLAFVLAERVDRTTLVVDCDFRRSGLSKLLNVPHHQGMADYLRGTATLDELIRPTELPNLFVLSCGKTKTDEVSELISRPEMETILTELRRRYDHVLIDTPPIAAVADAGMIGGLVGEALLVVRMNKTNKESVERAMNLLAAANVKPVGIVLTHRKYHIPKYIYRYS